jgi:hypothetical protein
MGAGARGFAPLTPQSWGEHESAPMSGAAGAALGTALCLGHRVTGVAPVTAGTAVGMVATACTRGNTPCSPRAGGAGWQRRGGKGQYSAVRGNRGTKAGQILYLPRSPPCQGKPLDEII